MQVVYIILTVFLVWLLAISALVIRIFVFFRRLSKGTDKDNLIKVIERLMIGEKENSKAISEIIKTLDLFRSDSKKHIQKIGLVRFNPFEEMGGDHSFSLALLDDEDTGIIITGLHTRDRTRVYIKDINKGKSKIEISKEEMKALKKAKDSSRSNGGD
jgi:hypothetical protein